MGVAYRRSASASLAGVEPAYLPLEAGCRIRWATRTFARFFKETCQENRPDVMGQRVFISLCFADVAFVRAPAESRTPDLLHTKQALYLTEL